MRVHVDNLLAANKIKVATDSHLKEENKYEAVGERRQRQLKEYAGAAVASVIQTFVKEDEDGLFWKDLKNSNYVEKYLHSEAPPPEYLKEIILTNNNVGNYQRRVEYFSTVLDIPGITPNLLLCLNFNANEGDDSDDESDKIKISALMEAVKKLLPEGLYCNPAITRHILNEAIRHRKRHGYGGAPCIKVKSPKWCFEMDYLMEIFNFITSSMNTQRNSFGVHNIVDEKGEKSPIACQGQGVQFLS